MARAAGRTISSAGLLGLLVAALGTAGCGALSSIPSPRVPLAAVAMVLANGAASTEFSAPGIATRAQGAYLTSCLELDAARSVMKDLPPEGEIGVVLVDAMPEDAKLSRVFANELTALGRVVVRLKPADLAAPSTLAAIVWILPRSGGLEFTAGDHMSYRASVRVLALDGRTRKPLFARSIRKEGSRDRVSDILGLLNTFAEEH